VDIDTDLDLSWLTDRPAWQQRALCAQVDPELWFPEKSGSPRGAKAICARCPVITDCREWALETGEAFGVLGGLSARERRRMLASTEPDAA